MTYHEFFTACAQLDDRVLDVRSGKVYHAPSMAQMKAKIKGAEFVSVRYAHHDTVRNDGDAINDALASRFDTNAMLSILVPWREDFAFDWRSDPTRKATVLRWEEICAVAVAR